MTAYFLHIGPSTLPRRHGQPLTLAEALHRAYGLPYAVIYRLRDDNVPVPVVADAGHPQEIMYVPTGRRVQRDTIAGRAVTEAGLSTHPSACAFIVAGATMNAHAG
jgi:hypothetical protein